MAFDSNDQLHVALWNSKTVERYDIEGNKLGQRVYEELNVPDGLAIDYFDNIYFANRGSPSTVTIYNSSGKLISTIKGFKSVIDVIDQHLKQMIVLDVLAKKAVIYS